MNPYRFVVGYVGALSLVALVGFGMMVADVARPERVKGNAAKKWMR